MMTGGSLAQDGPTASSPTPGEPAPEPLGLAAFDRWCERLDTHSETRQVLLFSPEIGPELDATERLKYHLLPGLPGFHSARLSVDETGRHRLEYTVQHGEWPATRSRRLTPATLRLTRLHCWLAECYRAQGPVDSRPLTEDELLQRVALRCAALGRYDLVAAILHDLADNFAGTAAAAWAAQLAPEIARLRADRRVLLWNEATGSGEGRNDLLLFGGYYGLWLGFAIPMALDADDPEPYGVGLLLGGPVGFTLASRLTRDADISEGRATMIALGGNLGTWQGLGWAAHADADAPATVATGIGAGLAGIGTAVWLTSHHDFSEGHAALTDAAMSWGAWFGMVVAGMSDANEILPPVLIGSDALLLITGLAARDVVMTEKQVRLLSLKGVVGAVMAMGAVLIAQPDSQEAAWGIIGLGSATGLVLGFHQAGESEPRKRDAAASGLSSRWPALTMQPDRLSGRGMMPAVGATLRF